MKLAGFNEKCSWLGLFARFHFWKSRNCRNATKKFFCLSLYFKIRKFIFRQSESCVLTMSSWSRRVKICGLKSSIEVQQPTVSGNLKKIFYSCLCTSFRSCYCVLTEKIDKNGSVVTIDHFFRLRVGSLLVSYGDSNGWPGGLLQATVCDCPIIWYHCPSNYWLFFGWNGFSFHLAVFSAQSIETRC